MYKINVLVTALVMLIRSKRDQLTPMLLELHWLPVKSRITFNTLLLTFKCLHDLAPTYLSALISPYCPTRSLRSFDQLLLKQPTAIMWSGFFVLVMSRAAACCTLWSLLRRWSEMPYCRQFPLSKPDVA